MSQYNIPRENMVIMTKVLVLVKPGASVMAALDPSLPNSLEFVNHCGLSRVALFNQVDASLRRLKTTYIDLLQIHAFDPLTPIEETMKALHDLVISGKVRYIGACNIRVWQLAEMNHVAEIHGWTQFISIQVEHSLLYRTEVSCFNERII
jgi:aryl-alcohol dehydrogenase-like predicted oxidoreductase